MAHFIASVLSLVFMYLAALHIYWLMGGKWLSDAYFPKLKNVGKPIVPGLLPTLVVTTGLICIGLFYLVKINYFIMNIPSWLSKNGLWAIAILFGIRAIGEFRYIGFFKKYKDSKFAEYDTKYYSPLCTAIALMTFVLGLLLK